MCLRLSSLNLCRSKHSCKSASYYIVFFSFSIFFSLQIREAASKPQLLDDDPGGGGVEGVELPARGLDLLRRQLEPPAQDGGRPRLDGVGVLDARAAVRPVHGQPGGRVDGRVDGADLF